MSLLLLTIFTIPVVFLTAAVVLPVRFRLRAQVDREPRLRLDLYTFGGIVPAIPVFDTTRKRKKSPRTKKNTASARSGKPFSGFSKRSALQLVAELLGQLKLIWIRGEAEFGLEDPADTGAVYGALSPIVYTSKYAAGIDLDIRPNFEQNGLSGNFDAAVEFLPIKLVPPVIRFGLSNFRS